MIYGNYLKSSPLFWVSSRANTFFLAAATSKLSFPLSPPPLLPLWFESVDHSSRYRPHPHFPPSFLSRRSRQTHNPNSPSAEGKKVVVGGGGESHSSRFSTTFSSSPLPWNISPWGALPLQPTRKRKVLPPPRLSSDTAKGGANWRRFTRFSQKNVKKKNRSLRQKITFPNLEIGLFLWLPPIDTDPTPPFPTPTPNGISLHKHTRQRKREEKGESDGRDRIEGGGGGEGGREQGGGDKKNNKVVLEKNIEKVLLQELLNYI